MKKIILITAVLVTAAAICRGQNTVVRKGSPEYYRLLRDTEAANAERAKLLEAGGSLFGTDARWTETKGEFSGTLLGKPSAEFRIGDWGCTRIPFQVVSKVSDSECLVLPDSSKPEIMLLRGFDMSKVTDGVEFILQHPVLIEGTFAYTTVAGAKKTVLVIENNDSKLKEFVAKQRSQAEAKGAAEEAEHEAIATAQQVVENAKRKTWTSANGQFTIVAKFGGVIGGVVKLEKSDGKRISVALEDLCKEDQEFIRERRWLDSSPRKEPTLEDVPDQKDFILWLTFDPNSITKMTDDQFIVRDSSGRGNNGIAQSAGQAEGKVGTALTFDGKDDLVSFETLGKELEGATELTLGMWLLARDTRRINFVFDLREKNGKAPSVIRLFFSEQEMAFGTPGGEIRIPVIQRTTRLEGEWHHLVCTWKSGTRRMYLDKELLGEQDGESSSITTAMLANASGCIGTQVGGFYGPRPKREPRGFVGVIDEFFILRRALSPNEVEQLFAKGRTR